MAKKKVSRCIQVAFRLPSALIERIDGHAEHMNADLPGFGATRTDAVRTLLTAALAPQHAVGKKASRKLKKPRRDLVIVTSAHPIDEQHSADVVVDLESGLLTKNRFGPSTFYKHTLCP